MIRRTEVVLQSIKFHFNILSLGPVVGTSPSIQSNRNIFENICKICVERDEYNAGTFRVDPFEQDIFFKSRMNVVCTYFDSNMYTQTNCVKRDKYNDGTFRVDLNEHDIFFDSRCVHIKNV